MIDEPQAPMPPVAEPVVEPVPPEPPKELPPEPPKELPPEQPKDEPAEEPSDTRVRWLVIVTAVLFVTTILFGLMAFFPSVAPIKSGPARLAVRAQEEQAIVVVAKRFAKNFLTIDYRTIDNDFNEVTSDATGKFKEQLGQVLKLSRKQFTDRKATSKGAVSESFVLSHKPDIAVVRVVVNRTIQNARTKGPETGSQVLDITLVKTSDGWKVDDLRQLGAQPNP